MKTMKFIGKLAILIALLVVIAGLYFHANPLRAEHINMGFENSDIITAFRAMDHRFSRHLISCWRTSRCMMASPRPWWQKCSTLR